MRRPSKRPTPPRLPLYPDAVRATLAAHTGLTAAAGV